MNRFTFIYLTSIIITTVLSGCNDINNRKTAEKWYAHTKMEILNQSNLQADSITYTFNQDSTFRKEHSFSGGYQFLLRGFNKGILRLETHYSRNGDFELRREICDNGNFGFEGIVYKDHFYGLSTWWHCNGIHNQEGIRFKDQKIGLWETLDEQGKLINQTDYKNTNKLDSMPVITVYSN